MTYRLVVVKKEAVVGGRIINITIPLKKNEDCGLNKKPLKKRAWKHWIDDKVERQINPQNKVNFMQK